MTPNDQLRAIYADPAEWRRSGFRGQGYITEVLVSRLLGGHLARLHNPGSDLVTPTHGRVEVKSKFLPYRGVRLSSWDFDHLVAIELDPEEGVMRGWLVPVDLARSLASPSKGLTFATLGSHPGVQDISVDLRMLAEEEVPV